MPASNTHTYSHFGYAAHTLTQGHREQIPAHWPAEVSDLIRRCWATDPAGRPSMGDVAAALKSFRADNSVLVRLVMDCRLPDQGGCSCTVS